jgi:D-inositol-3-phosphate glycosyltransferase
VVLGAAAVLAQNPSIRDRLRVVVCGGPSGSGLDRPNALIDQARSLGIQDIVRFEPPGDRQALADWYRAADLTIVPSHSESFGLVAVESQACGTPVVAASVGGLRTAVADGVSGVLIPGHDPRMYAETIMRLLANSEQMNQLRAGARMHAAGFGWDNTARGLLDTYRAAIDESRPHLSLVSP